MQTKE